MAGRADSNMISDALAGAAFASQTGTICRVSGRLTSRQPHTKYGFIINFGRNIWDFWHVETSADLWFTDPYHNRFDLIQCDDMIFNAMTWRAPLVLKRYLEISLAILRFFAISATMFWLFGCIFIDLAMSYGSWFCFFLPWNLISLFTQAHLHILQVGLFFGGISPVYDARIWSSTGFIGSLVKWLAPQLDMIGDAAK